MCVRRRREAEEESEEDARERYSLGTLLKQALMGEIKMNRKGKFPEMSCSLPRDAVQSQQHGPHGKHRVGAKLSTGAMALPRGSA